MNHTFGDISDNWGVHCDTEVGKSQITITLPSFLDMLPGLLQPPGKHAREQYCDLHGGVYEKPSIATC